MSTTSVYLFFFQFLDVEILWNLKEFYGHVFFNVILMQQRLTLPTVLAQKRFLVKMYLLIFLSNNAILKFI